MSAGYTLVNVVVIFLDGERGRVETTLVLLRLLRVEPKILLHTTEFLYDGYG